MTDSPYKDYQWGDYWTPPEDDNSKIPEDVIFDHEEGRYRHCLNLAEILKVDWYERNKIHKTNKYKDRINTLSMLVDTNLHSKVEANRKGEAS
jgi:hypothetical protein